MRMLSGAMCVFVASVSTGLAQDAKSIEKLSTDCSKRDDKKTCDKFYAAVGELKDPALLAKIAVEAKDPVWDSNPR